MVQDLWGMIVMWISAVLKFPANITSSKSFAAYLGFYSFLDFEHITTPPQTTFSKRSSQSNGLNLINYYQSSKSSSNAKPGGRIHRAEDPGSKRPAWYEFRSLRVPHCNDVDRCGWGIQGEEEGSEKKCVTFLNQGSPQLRLSPSLNVIIECRIKSIVLRWPLWASHGNGRTEESERGDQGGGRGD